MVNLVMEMWDMCVNMCGKNVEFDGEKIGYMWNIVAKKLFSTLIPKNFKNFTNDFVVIFIECENKQKNKFKSNRKLGDIY